MRWILAVGLVLPSLSLLFAQEPQSLSPREAGKARDLTKLTPGPRTLYLTAQRGAEWLVRANKQDGRFVYGFLPALRLPMEGDHFARQAAAAYTVARAGQYFGDDRAIAIARQAILSLLLETVVEDTPQGKVRYSAGPNSLVNRVETAGWMIAAIYECPHPQADLVEAAEQFTRFLAKNLQTDGSLQLSDPSETTRPADQETLQQCSGPGLFGLLRSQQGSKDAKLEALKRARSVYLPAWRQTKNLPMLPGHTAAYTEAYLASRDPAFAEAVFEMNDWLCGYQYQNLDPRRSHWHGGFHVWSDGKMVAQPPDIQSALAVESLAHACRTAKAANDLSRRTRYQQALENGLKFLSGLQYTEGNCHHYAEWYQKLLIGGFHGSHTDGNLRLDYTQQTVSALVTYLQGITD